MPFYYRSIKLTKVVNDHYEVCYRLSRLFIELTNHLFLHLIEILNGLISLLFF